MWLKNLKELNPEPPANLLSWLQVPNNLGKALRTICNELSVKIISEQFENFFADEQSILHDSRGYVRTILLQGDHIPYCYCRTTVPQTVYDKYEPDFRLLGLRLIGETMLYNNPNTTRTAFEYCNLNGAHKLYHLINQSSPKQSLSYHARRSVFLMNGADPILITEVFFETLLAHLNV